jgi:hypothetical protein
VSGLLAIILSHLYLTIKRNDGGDESN